MCMKNLLLATSMLVILLCMACEKDPKIERLYFEFEMPFSITPSSDTVLVGDTLYLVGDFSDSLFDAASRKKFGLNCFPFPSFMTICELTFPDKNFAFQKGATDAFDLIFDNIYGGVTGSSYANVNLLCNNNRYYFRLKIVPRRRGVFSLKITDNDVGSISLPDYLAPSTPEIKRIPTARYNRHIFNQGNTHFEIFKKHAQHALPDGNWPLLEEYGTYTFVVK